MAGGDTVGASTRGVAVTVAVGSMAGGGVAVSSFVGVAGRGVMVAGTVVYGVVTAVATTTGSPAREVTVSVVDSDVHPASMRPSRTTSSQLLLLITFIAFAQAHST